jgi:molybdate transport system substrate-binding protein
LSGHSTAWVLKRFVISPHLRLITALALTSLVVSCRKAEIGPAITVAAAANTSEAFDEIGAAFQRDSGIRVVYSYGSTAQLTRQIESSAPFDVFAAADVEHIDELVRKGKLKPDSRAVYARGRLALWLPKIDSPNPPPVSYLTKPSVRYVSIADPSLAPYGKAAVEALKATGIWDSVKGKVVYATNINMAKQHAASGNADAAFTALSLLKNAAGAVVTIDEKLHTPLDQALGILTSSARPNESERFRAFVLGPVGASVLDRYGYVRPATTTAIVP